MDGKVVYREITTGVKQDSLTLLPFSVAANVNNSNLILTILKTRWAEPQTYGSALEVQRTGDLCSVIEPFLYWKFVLETYVNSADPVQMPHSAASDQDLHFLLTEVSMQKQNENKNIHQKPLKAEMDSSSC